MIMIAADAKGAAVHVVCVGDYIDRGENSASVLRRLYGISKAPNSKMICLMGNHEEMMLGFLDDPDRYARLWLKNGGMQTLASFQVAGARQNMSGARLKAARAELEAALGPELIAWIRALPRAWSSGNVTVVHAGADPERGLSDQLSDVLTWGHADFLRTPRQDGQWVIHGHTIVPEAVPINGRIGVDTGAFATGRLSAVCVSPAEVRPLVASAKRSA